MKITKVFVALIALSGISALAGELDESLENYSRCVMQLSKNNSDIANKATMRELIKSCDHEKEIFIQAHPKKDQAVVQKRLRKLELAAQKKSFKGEK